MTVTKYIFKWLLCLKSHFVCAQLPIDRCNTRYGSCKDIVVGMYIIIVALFQKFTWICWCKKRQSFYNKDEYIRVTGPFTSRYRTICVCIFTDYYLDNGFWFKFGSGNQLIREGTDRRFILMQCTTKMYFCSLVVSTTEKYMYVFMMYLFSSVLPVQCISLYLCFLSAN